jgi:site-specific recombinase XerC
MARLRLQSSHRLPDDPVDLYLARQARSEHASLRSAIKALDELRGTTPWPDLRYPDVARIRLGLCERYGIHGAQRSLSIVRGILRECWRLGSIDAETLARTLDVPPIRGVVAPAGRHVPHAEMRLLCDHLAADTSPRGRRDLAAVGLLWALGCRLGELRALRLGDVHGDELLLRGKGRRERLGYLEDATARGWLEQWIAVRGDAAGYVLCPVYRGHPHPERPLPANAVQTALRDATQALGIGHIAPHDFRRTFVGDLLTAGADLSTVQRLAGHASPRTTAGYDRRPGEAARAAVRGRNAL